MAQRINDKRTRKRQSWSPIYCAVAVTYLLISAPLMLVAKPYFSISSKYTAIPGKNDTTPASYPNAQEKPEAIQLEPGQVIAKELKADASHSYLVKLETGQFMHVVVEQQGIDVVVALFGADGQQIAEFDSPNGTRGPEPVFAIAEATGTFRLAVRALEKNAVAGRYEIKIEALRAATNRDRKQALAEKTFAQAELLRAKGTGESLREAALKYSETLSTWRELGDRGREAATLSHLGNIYHTFGELQKSYVHFNQALLLHQAAGDRQGEALMLNNLGLLNDLLGEPKKALEFFDRALAIRRALGDKGAEATTLNNIGSAYNSLGEKQKALDYFNQALPLSRAAGDRRGEAVTLNNIGLIYYFFDEAEKALVYYRQALPLHLSGADPGNVIHLLNNIGAAFQALDKWPDALKFHEQALIVSRAVGHQREQAVSLSNIGAAHWSLGEKQKALDHYKQAHALLAAIGERRSAADVLINLSGVHWSLGDYPKAIESSKQALGEVRAIGNRIGEAMALFMLASANVGLGNLTEARAEIEAALVLIEALRGKVATHELRASYFATYQQYYDLYIDLLMKIHQQDRSAGADVLALEASERARARGLLELLHEARAEIRRGVDPAFLERERSLQDQIDVKAQRQMTLLSGTHTPEQAQAIAAEFEVLRTEYQSVEARIRQANPQYAALTQPQTLSVKEIQQQVLDPDTLLLEYKMGQRHFRNFLWAVTQTSVHSYELPPTAEIVEAVQRVFLLLTARNYHPKDETAAERQARLLKAELEFPEASHRLSRMLLGPAAEHLNKKRIIIVAQQAILLVPFAALPKPQVGGGEPKAEAPPLIVEHEIVNLPSASVIAVLRAGRLNRPRTPKTVAVLADPVFDKNDSRVAAKERKVDRHTGASRQKVTGPGSAPGLGARTPVERAVREAGVTEEAMDLPRLPFSRREAAAILAIVPDKQGMAALDFKASRATVADGALADYRIIHFATHGLFNNQHPELSGIVLSLVDEEGKPQDGFLRMHDIYNLHLPADLVVLSACRTAWGREIRGEGMIGLTRGFMYAGATRVAATMWVVDDAATAELMSYFYRGMLKDGQRPAAALRAAQVQMWKQRRWQSPYYWAAFVLQGEWK